MNSTRTSRATAIAAALTAIALAPFTAQAQAAAPASAADEIAALREQIRLLDQKLRVLERNLEIKDETAAAEAKKQPKLTASEGRIEIASADGANSLRLRGLVQADARFFFDDADAAQDQFLLRRARLGFEGRFAERYSFIVQPEFAGSTVSILDANLAVAITPALNVRVGRFKTPVGLEQLQSDSVAFFNERSIATNLAPNRDVGVGAFGSVFEKRLGYQVSVTNGVIDGGNSPASSANPEGDFTLAARLFATPFAEDKDSPLKGLGFGLAGAAGNYGGTTANPLVNAYRTDGQQTFFAYRGATVADGTATVLSPQAHFYSGPFGLLAEYFRNTAELRNGANAREVTNQAWNLSVGWVLTGEEASYRGVTPKQAFNLSAGTWGAFEIVARVAHVDIDDNVFVGAGTTSLASPNNATEITSYGIGLNWYLSRTVRAGFNVFRSDHKLAPAATVPASGNALSDDETVFISRVQVAF